MAVASKFLGAGAAVPAADYLFDGDLRNFTLASDADPTFYL